MCRSTKAFLDLDDDVQVSLERLIGNASCRDARALAVADPSLIRDCGPRLMREQEGTIDWLSKYRVSISTSSSTAMLGTASYCAVCPASSPVCTKMVMMDGRASVEGLSEIKRPASVS